MQICKIMWIVFCYARYKLYFSSVIVNTFRPNNTFFFFFLIGNPESKLHLRIYEKNLLSLSMQHDKSLITTTKKMLTREEGFWMLARHLAWFILIFSMATLQYFKFDFKIKYFLSINIFMLFLSSDRKS